MRIRAATVPLHAPRQHVFDYLADPRKHAEWATEFIQHMEEEEDGQLWADTAMGRVSYAVEADADTGVIDIRVTPADGPTVRFPARVVEIAPGVSAFAFTMAQPPDMPDDEFDRGYASLERELGNLQDRFSR